MPSHIQTLHFSKSASETIAQLVAARVDFVMLGERTSPLTIVPAPYARNLERLARLRTRLGTSGLTVQHALSSRYQELLYESLPRELAPGVRVEIVPDGLVGQAGATVFEPQIRASRAAEASA